MSSLTIISLTIFCSNAVVLHPNEDRKMKKLKHRSYSYPDVDGSNQFRDIDLGYPTHRDWINFSETNNISVYLPINVESTDIDDIELFKNKSKTFFSMYDGNLPSAIIECFSEQDVVNTMEFLSDSKHNKQEFSIKSGGHGFGGYNKIKGAAMISVSNMKEIELIDLENGIISVETGVEQHELTQFLIDNNLTHLVYPTGQCPTVSFGGLVTGGGISGFSARVGLPVDTVVGIEIVLFDGVIINTYLDDDGDDDDDEYNDLLWAVKGSGGGNFGIITKYYLQSVQDININNKYARYSTIEYEIDGNYTDLQENIYNCFNGLSELMDDDLFKYVTFNLGGSPDSCYLWVAEGGLYKTDEDNEYILDEIVATMNNYMGFDAVNVTSEFDEYYAILQGIFDDYAGLPDVGFPGMDQVRYIKSWRRDTDSNNNKNNRVAEIISVGITDLYFTFNDDDISPVRFGHVSECMRGKVLENDINNLQTSVQNRDAYCAFHIGIRWRYDPEQDGIGLKYIKIIEDNLLDLISSVNYIGYINNLSGNAKLEQYYPNKKVFKKQRQIKTKYDPFNRFRFEMSIPPLKK